MTGLTIYRASAGSGKTFALSSDFIRLVLRVPEKYRHILAVTFTNKATAEMKSRVLGELNKLARGIDSDMRAVLEKESGLQGQELDRRARKVLDTILHDFSHFYIETIDRFFQRAIRVFTREIGLTAGYQVELDSEPVLSKAVDRLINGLDQEPEMLDWVESYARERVEEGKHWNMKQDILELAKEINRERFQEKGLELRKILAEKDKLLSYLKSMDGIRYGFENRLSGLAGKALQIMEDQGVETGDFKHAPDRNIGNYFHRWAGGEYKTPGSIILKSNDNPAEWVIQGSEAENRVLAAYHNGLGDCLRDCLRLFSEEYTDYRSSVVIKKYFHVLGILNEISEHMYACTREQGIFLLSDASAFLHGIIAGNEAPFIYEKIGNYFQHYMIDEFQDTSSMQWKNFLPLIDNSLAYMRENLVVGDVKQSIYRWRNSDWEILSEKIHRQCEKEQLNFMELDQNWRSRRNIVAFNNDFFSGAMQVYSDHFSNGDGEKDYGEKIRNAYSDLVQKVPDLPAKEGGYVSISLIEPENTEDWITRVHERVIASVELLQDRGLQPSDMAILVRTGREGKQISDALLDHKSRHPGSGYKYDVISNESLFLANASSIRVILGVMRYLNQPGDRLNRAWLLVEYRRLFPGTGPFSMPEILSSGAEGILPAVFHEAAGGLKYLTLTELVEKIIHLLDLNSKPSQIPYLIAFQDKILDYSKNKAADIQSFLDWWEEFGEKQALSLSEDQNAIRVMTIHKAKGLEFRAVIIPYCNWSLDHRAGLKPNILWCSPDREPFSQLPLVPVVYGRGLKDTIFRKDYEEEHYRVYMDHLNLLYVAMTRARDALIVFGRKGKSNKLGDASDLLDRVLGQHPMSTCHEAGWDENRRLWSLGEMNFKRAGKTPGETETSLINQLSSHAFSGKLRLMYRGMDFFDPRAKERINRGNLMHDVFSRIIAHEDIDRALEGIRREGLIGGEDAAGIRREIEQILQVEPYRGWFDGSWKVITERDILDRGGALKRPDRVMMKEGRVIVVDYKFGYSRTESHKKQVRQYMNILTRMQYPDIRGYIWYVLQGELVEI